MSKPVVVGLAQAIAALRSELNAAIREGVGEELQFGLDPIELTVEVAVTKDADGKVGWQVLELGGSYESVRTQILKLRLTPTWRAPDGSVIKDFTIASQEPAGQAFGGDTEG